MHAERVQASTIATPDASVSPDRSRKGRAEAPRQAHREACPSGADTQRAPAPALPGALALGEQHRAAVCGAGAASSVGLRGGGSSTTCSEASACACPRAARCDRGGGATREPRSGARSFMACALRTSAVRRRANTRTRSKRDSSPRRRRAMLARCVNTQEQRDEDGVDQGRSLRARPPGLRHAGSGRRASSTGRRSRSDTSASIHTSKAGSSACGHSTARPPTSVAAPLPPRKPWNSGHTWPSTAAKAQA